MNIDIAIVGLIITGVGLALKIIAEIKSELRKSLEREAFQNQKIENCFHQVELLKHELDGHKDKYILLAKGLEEGIEHARKRLFEEIERVGSQISEIKLDIKTISQDLAAQSKIIRQDLEGQNKHYEYRLNPLENKNL